MTASPPPSMRWTPRGVGSSLLPPSRTPTPGRSWSVSISLRRFAGIHGPELDGTNDHKGDLIAHIIAREGVLAERAVMIGDREFDVTAAARNGIPTVGVTWGYGTAGELVAAGACALCPAPAGLAAIVLGL